MEKINTSPLGGLTKLEEAGVNWREIYKKLDKVFDERIKQNKKFGVQNHNALTWSVILMEEVGEVAREALDSRLNWDGKTTFNYEKEIIQVIAVGFAMLESLHNEKESNR